MSAVDQQLAYEARAKPRQAVIAAGAAVLLVAAAAIQLAGPHTKVNELTLDLITAHRRFPLDLIGAIVNGFGLTALAVTLVFLFRMSRARKPRTCATSSSGWRSAGPSSPALTGIVYAVLIASKASTFVSHGAQTYQQANQLTTGGGLLALPLFGQASALVLAVGFVLISLNAMRVGLLTRFMGYLGIFTGVLVLFPIGSPVPVVQAFWLLALAYLLTNRWPSGVPSSWRSGQAEPWPSSAELREQRSRTAGRHGADKPPKSTKPAQPAGAVKVTRQDVEETVAGGQAARTRSGTPKRKRKRRH